jgi:two-component system, cell cycle response regulator
MFETTEEARPLRLLIAERRGWMARTLLSVLDTTQWTSSHVHTGAEVLELIRRGKFDVIVLHDDIDDANVVDLCSRLRTEPHAGPTTPVVIVSTDPTRTRRIVAHRAGAWDYVVLPMDPELLLLRLEIFGRAHREVDRLSDSALLDPETGLYNSAGIERRSEEVASDARRRHDPLSCVALLPESASNGDVWARTAETLVPELGRLVRRSARISDVMGRGDTSLVIIAPATPEDGAQRLIERLRGAIWPDAETRTSVVKGAIGMRAGYCSAADFSRSTLSIREMLDRARKMLDAAQRSGDPTRAVAGESVPLAPPS